MNPGDMMPQTEVMPDVPSTAPKVLITPRTGLKTSERGTQATFTVALTATPTAEVTFALSSSNPFEGIVSPPSLTFTPANARAPQTVTITGVNDDEEDGDTTFNVVLAPATSEDQGFAGMTDMIPVVNIDDEKAGFTVIQTAPLRTWEAGTQVQFAVVANSKPSADVTLPVASSDTTEGTVSPAALVFTAANWNAPQLVTVTGMNDNEADGDKTFTITLGPSTSTDVAYAGISPMGPLVTNADDESPGVVVTGGNLSTSEAGGQASFTVALQSRPNSPVTVPLSSGDTGEGTVSPATLIFTSVNWNAPQTVTITGVDDDAADGNQLYAIVLGTLQSSDSAYNGLNPADLAVTNIDNDSPGVTVTRAPLLQVSESGTQATFTVALNSQPSAGVSFAVGSSDPSEGTATPSLLTFTSANWNAPQTVTVTGVNDNLADGNQAFLVTIGPAISGDAGYAGLDPADVPVVNIDNDSAGFTVSAASNLTTTEAGGTATFTVALNSQPSANVTIGLSSSDTGEGTVAPASLTFTAANWNAPQIVTVTGIDDNLADGSQPYTIVTAPATSTDPGYSGRDAANVTVTNTDDDSAGFTVSAVSGKTSEAGATATFTVRLNSEPTADVTIAVSSTDTSEGTVAPASLTFTADNWQTPQTVTITGVDDMLVDGEQTFTIALAPATSTDTAYAGRNPVDVTVANVDDEGPGITVIPTTGLVTTEGGGTATFTIVLNSMPLADVVIPLSSSAPSEGTLDQQLVAFAPVNWNLPRTVTITGVGDAIADGNQPYTIITAPATSNDPAYAGRDAANVSVTNTDDDTVGITVGTISGKTSETGTTATFTVRLNSQPTADVTIALSSTDTTEGTVSPGSLVFTPANWQAAQVVTVTGVDDQVRDGNQTFSIALAPAESTDANYNNFNADDVTVTNDDEDLVSGFIVATDGEVLTGEDGRTGTFTVRLKDAPTGTVVLPLASSNTAEATVSPAMLSFTSADWALPKTVTVTGVDDAAADGNQAYEITFAPATGDPRFYDIRPDNIRGRNFDDEFTAVAMTQLTIPAGCFYQNGEADFSLGRSRVTAVGEDGSIYYMLRCPTTERRLFYASRDGGQTFAAPVEFPYAESTRFLSGEVAAGGDGLVYVADVANRALLRSQDGGRTFTTLPPFIPADKAGGVRLFTATGRRLAFVVTMGTPGDFTSTHEYLATSDDAGATVELTALPAPMGTYPNIRYINLVALTVRPDGRLTMIEEKPVIFSGSGAPPTTYWVRTSDDGGRSLSPGVQFAPTSFFPQGTPRTRFIVGRNTVFGSGAEIGNSGPTDFLITPVTDPTAVVHVTGGFSENEGAVYAVDATETLTAFAPKNTAAWLDPGATAFGPSQSLADMTGRLAAHTLSPTTAVLFHFNNNVLSYTVVTRP
jgi:hypothetical protein